MTGWGESSPQPIKELINNADKVVNCCPWIDAERCSQRPPLAQNGLANWEWAHCERGDDTLFHKK